MADFFELMVAPTGARLQKSDHPAVPVTPTEMAETAEHCAALGASCIHIHVRDEIGRHSLDPKLYDEACAAITDSAEIDIQITTEAAGIFNVKAQQDCLLRRQTKNVSVALREMARAPDQMAHTYHSAASQQIRLQHILYDADEVTKLRRYFEAGTIPETYNRVLFVLGRYTTQQRAEPSELLPFLDAMGPDPLHWSVCAFGPKEHACVLAALQNGGHARIGFENSQCDEHGHPYRDNAASVAAFVQAANKAGFTPTRSTSS